MFLLVLHVFESAKLIVPAPVRSMVFRRLNPDVVAPVIRDIGAALAMHPQPETVRMIISGYTDADDIIKGINEDGISIILVEQNARMALQFANAWGCHVTAFTSPGKVEEAKQMGAHDTLNSRDPEDVNKAAGRFDLILCRNLAFTYFVEEVQLRDAVERIRSKGETPGITGLRLQLRLELRMGDRDQRQGPLLDALAV